MPQSSKDVFYFMSDLTDAFADLSIAMRKWHAELENSLPDADHDSATITKQTADDRPELPHAWNAPLGLGRGKEAK